MTMEQVQDIVEALASRLRRSVAVDDHTLQLVAASPDQGDSDPARVWSLLHRRTRPDDVAYAQLRSTSEPTRVAARPDVGLHARLAVPIRHDGALLGFLWLIDADGSVTADEHDDAVAAAEALAVLLHQRLVVRDRDRALSTHLLEQLLGPAPAERAAAAADLLRHGFVDDDAHVGVLVVTACDDVDVRATVHQAGRSLPPAGNLVTASRRHATVLLAGRRPVAGPLRAAADTVVKALPGVRVGLGAPTQGLGAASAAARQAQVAVTVAAARGDAPGIVAFADLGPYALLGQLPPDLVDNDLLPLGLFTLLRLGPGHELLHTLEAFLDCAGDKQRTAQFLAVHRSTLYHRLDRIEQLSGLDLADGGDRLLAHVAIKLHRIGRTP